MSVIKMNRHVLSAALVAASFVAAGSAQAAATATVTLDAGLLSALGFLGASVTAAGTGVSFNSGAFAAPIAGVSLAAAGPSAASVTWNANASLTIANSQATAVFSGFVFDAATSEITADIAFSSATLTKAYNDVGFLIVKSPVGSVGGSASLNAVLTSSSAVPITFSGAGYFDIASLSPVILELGVPSTIVSSLGVNQAASVVFSGTTTVTGPSAVPEPATLSTMLIGLGLLGGLATRRRAK
ncbi:MAG: PEP-CTERM sorting domain-containing protein [Aquabacterium sp.]